ncbi:lactosylceramide 1,3-N-acetyl-beta-D-glucosaminyltransferase-like [Mizuhopecten yessoensis]|uniref:lactosylceramide 1,3-N-acetyl-beta-D-glucosaminyltransferase-like n=1 Tax=Mizuhopecten yessoensis TaxID=6573 RepID=UPI000B45BDFC|nr:lactosylceramide 1,3-N-acetyl-beta-D-glucosaminyltransferase-like [Mizuhopecten yessoensis]
MMARWCNNQIYAISFMGTWPKRLLSGVPLVIVAFLVGLCFYLHVREEDIYSRGGDNRNVESWIHSSPPSRSFFALHVDILSIVNRQLLNLTTDIGEINPHPFRYINNPGHCQFNSNGLRTVLVLVKSTVRNVLLRQAIRTTWGNISEENVKIVFMLGRNLSNDLQRTIDQEAARYKDLVQEDFIDAYFNNTLKSIMSFNWATQYCGNAQFLLFVDDDFVIDLPKIQRYIYSIPETDVETLFIGHRITQPVVRDQNSKWGLSSKVYPYKYWPPYLAGGAFLASMQVARKFSFAFPYIQSLGIDDAWLGIVARNVRVHPQDHHFFHNNGRHSHLALVYQCCHTQKEMLNIWWQHTHNTSFRFGKL